MTRGLIYDGKKIRVVRIGEGGFTEDDILVHDAHSDNIGIHMALVDMKGPRLPRGPRSDTRCQGHNLRRRRARPGQGGHVEVPDPLRGRPAAQRHDLGD